MPKLKRESAEPSDPDTLIREIRKLAQRHGWEPTSSSVDAEGAVVVSFAVPKAAHDEGAQE